MRSTFKQRHCVVTRTTRVVNQRFDATQVTDIDYMRADGHIFSVKEAWGYYSCAGGKEEVFINDEKWIDALSNLDAWLKKHALPSMQWLEDQLRIEAMHYEEDPMGSLADYE